MNIPKLERNQLASLIVAVGALVGFIALLLVSLRIGEQGHNSCPAIGEGCSVIGHIPGESFLGLGALAIVAVAGAFMAIKPHKPDAKQAKPIVRQVPESAAKLKGEEKAVYDLLVRHEGTVFQGDIIKELGYSKVKTSRILDRLEANGLVERRRRGMANMVIAKG